ncbi:4-hydroxybenzoate octaprenyltransferase [Zavarzinia sp. CC-PAN008]|uniref:4-hydroxybenzoate octaprenyltransferase n=1 Tax=Zavarzinia sp. CC-PAN008 TaxID=3243332 RepID=UPI003F74ABAB
MSLPADRIHNSWVDHAPGWVKPYLRLARFDRPIGTWLLLFPCLWSAALVAGALAQAGDHWTARLPNPLHVALFAIGAVAMRGAGCTINDIVDRDIDAAVARTRGRPLPSGAVTLRGALAFLGLQLAVGLAVLLCFNTFTIALAASSLVIVAAYPFMKRITYWPQVVLGLAFNWGALVGWSAVTGDLGLPAVLLYAAGITWTLGYDTIYAHQDKADDAIVGVKSSALALGSGTRPFLFAIYGVTWVLLGLAGLTAGLGFWYVLALGPAFIHLFWQAMLVRLDEPEHCLMTFRSNVAVGWLVLAALVIGALVKPV